MCLQSVGQKRRKQSPVRLCFPGTEKFAGTVQITLHAVLDVLWRYSDLPAGRTYRNSVGTAEKTVDLDAGTYEITGINAYDEQQEPVTVYY